MPSTPQRTHIGALTTSYKTKAGYTLIEIVVVLAVTAAIGLAIWKLLPAMRASTVEEAPQAQLLEAQQALEGFILRQHRLPCADADNDGNEDCGSAAVAGALPYKTLGLSQAVAARSTIRYAAFRNPNATTVGLDADLLAAKARYLPPVPPTPPPTVSAITGLDFCVAVKNGIALAPGGVATSGSVPVAFALVHPGANGLIEAVNNSASFAVGSGARDINYDDHVLTAGLSELFGRFNCPERLGQANGAARAAYAAYDIDREATFHERFRTFDVRVQKQLLAVARLNVVLAAVDAAITAAAAAIAAAAAVDTTGVTLVLSVIAIPLAIAQSAYNLATAIIAVTEAEAALADSEANLVAATAHRTGTALLYLNARNQAVALRAKGIIL